MRIFNVLRKNSKIFLCIFDILCIIAAYYFSRFFLADLQVAFSYSQSRIYITTMLVAIAFYELFLNLFGVYKHITKYENGKDYLVYVFICLISAIFTIITAKVFLNYAGVKLNLLSCILISMFIISYRVIFRFIVTNLDTIKYKNEDNEDIIKPKNLLIIGAGCGARDIIKTIKTSMKDEYNII